MKDTVEGYELSSGRVIAANNGILGLQPNEDGTLTLTDGYDSYAYAVWPREGGASPFHDKHGNEIPLRDDERREIAEAMVERWRKWGRL